MVRSNQYTYMDEDFVGPALLCIICKKPFKDPQCTPCNHAFCRECITRWMTENEASCPACRRPMSIDRLLPISNILNNMLGRLFVKCLLCGQTKLRQVNFDDHIRRVCPNAQRPLVVEQQPTSSQLSTCTIQSNLSMFREIFAEIRQLREQTEQQLILIQRHAAQMERITQCYNEQQTKIDELRHQIENDLSTARFLSQQPLSPNEKTYYDHCKEYYHIMKQPLISIASEIFDDQTEIYTSLFKIGIDEDCSQFNLRNFLHEFCEKIDLHIDDIIIKKIQNGSVILEAEIDNKLKSPEKKLHLKMIYNKLTDKLKKIFGKMKIFFMFFGPVKTLLKIQKDNLQIKLNPKHNRIYARGHVFWEGALNDGKDRGNKPYYCPLGWQRSSFYVTENFYEKFKGWCICYHGTKFEYGLSILLNGLKPAHIGIHGPGIYATPSVNYACHPRYAEVKKIPSSSRKFFKSGAYIQFVLECRVHPRNIKKIDKETLQANDIIIDPNITNDIIEWLVDTNGKDIVDFNDPDATIVCTGILIRVTDKHPGLLPESEWWYKAHLCERSKCCLLNIDLSSLKEDKEKGNVAKIIFT